MVEQIGIELENDGIFQVFDIFDLFGALFDQRIYKILTTSMTYTLIFE